MRFRFSARQVSILVLAVAFCVAAAAGAEAEKVSLNTGTVSELETLPGIGPSLAERILEFRNANGPFKRSEDLMNVPGIGESKYLQIKELVTVDPIGGNGKKRP